MKITKRQLRRIIREEKAKVLAEQKVRRIVRRRLIEQAGFSSRSLPWNMGSDYMPPRSEWEEYDFDESYPVVQAVNALGVDVQTGDEIAVIDTESDTDAEYEMIAGMDLPVIKQLGNQMALHQLPDGVEAIMLNDRGTGMIIVRSSDIGR